MSITNSRALAVALVTTAVFTDILAYSIAVPVLPHLSREFGASPTLIGLLFASFGVTLFAVSVPMGSFSDRVGRRLPLVGGLLALVRLTPAHLQAPERATLVYGLCCLALVAWGLSGLWIFAAPYRNAGVATFPSPGDLGYVAGGLLWSAAIWVLYEGGGS